MDYERVKLYVDGDLVKWPRVVGAGWEKAAKLSDSYGPWGVTDDDVKQVTFFHVDSRGEVEVALTTQDKALALGINKAIHKMLHTFGLMRVGAPDQRMRNTKKGFVKDENGKVLSHDLVVQKIGVNGLWSVEVKCVNRTTYKGLLEARKSHRKRALKFWKRIGETQRPDDWKGRLLVLVWLHDDRNSFSVKVDIYDNEKNDWLGLYGWQGQDPNIDTALAPPKHVTELDTARSQNRKRLWADVESELFPDPSTPEGKKIALFALRPKTQVCRATDAFHKARLPNLHIKQDLQCWARANRPRWVLGKDYDKVAPAPCGGPAIWCVARHVAQYVYNKKQ